MKFKEFLLSLSLKLIRHFQPPLLANLPRVELQNPKVETEQEEKILENELSILQKL